jgi:hypothetical protein
MIVVKPQFCERKMALSTVVLLKLWRRFGGQEHSDEDDEEDEDEEIWLNLRHDGCGTANCLG